MLFCGVLFWQLVFFWQFLAYFILFLLYQQGYGLVSLSLVVMYIANASMEQNTPFEKHGVDGRWDKFIDSFIVQSPNEWFPIRLIRTAELPPNRQYIFGLSPHGFMPWPLFPIGRSKEWRALFPDIDVRCLGASVLFKIPVARECTIWLGGCPANWKNCCKALESGKSIALIPGGSDELLESNPDQEIVILAKRKGFIRLALMYGCDLVPSYAFGVNDLYTQMKPFKHARRWVLKKTRVAFTFGWGRQLYNLMPLQRPLNIVFGAPIRVPKIPNPSNEAVDTLHKRYLDSLTEIYEKHKGQFGFKDKKLEIW